MASKKGSKKATTQEVVELQRLKRKKILFKVKGISSLISHSWSYKAKREILDKQMKKAKQARLAKDPWIDFCETLYWLTPKPYNESELPTGEDKTYPTDNHIKKAKFGFPSIGFKNAMVTAVTSMSNITKVAARQAFHVLNEFIEIIGQPTIREDMVRLGGPGSPADIRHRAEFQDWEAVIPIEFNENVFSSDQIANLLANAGFGVGVGDWRPEKNGSHGMFEIVTQK